MGESIPDVVSYYEESDELDLLPSQDEQAPLRKSSTLIRLGSTYLEESTRKSRYRNAHVLGAGINVAWKSKQAHSLHSLVPRLGGFPPALARWAIETYSHPGDTILDPFCGKGTAPLEALLAGRNAV